MSISFPVSNVPVFEKKIHAHEHKHAPIDKRYWFYLKRLASSLNVSQCLSVSQQFPYPFLFCFTLMHDKLCYNKSRNIAIKHSFSCINIRQVPWEVLKTETEGRGFQHLPRDLANVNTLKNHVRSLLLHNN